MSEYHTVTCRLPAEGESRLAEVMEKWPVLGCQVEDAGEEVLVTVFLAGEHGTVVSAVAEGLQALGGRAVGSALFSDRDWLAEYRRSLAAWPLGRRLWIDPRPETPTPPPAGRVSVVVEPRQAFGTGSHESTRLVLLVMEDLPLAGRQVLDIGTGSGILALAALAMGADTATAFDVDLEAVFCARQIILQQPEPRAVRMWAGPLGALSSSRRFELVLANLLPHEFLPLAEAAASHLAPGGSLVLSGLLADQEQAVVAELETYGLRPGGSRRLGEWVALVCGHDLSVQ